MVMEELASSAGKEREKLAVEQTKYDGNLPQTVGAEGVNNKGLQQAPDSLAKIYHKVLDSNRTAKQGHDAVEWYIELTADYINKLTIASVLFLTNYPWVALWWPPYYFSIRRPSSHSSQQ